MPALQGGQINTMGIGPIAKQPAALIEQPVISSQPTWPSSPVILGTTSTTPAPGDTEAIVNTAQVEQEPMDQGLMENFGGIAGPRSVGGDGGDDDGLSWSHCCCQGWDCQNKWWRIL